MERCVWYPVRVTFLADCSCALNKRSLDITTNNPATQVYTAYGLDVPRKIVHGGPSLNYTVFSAVAIEQEGYIDAINTPEWHIDQICQCLFIRFAYVHSFYVFSRWSRKRLHLEFYVQVFRCPLTLWLSLSCSALQVGVSCCRLWQH